MFLDINLYNHQTVMKWMPSLNSSGWKIRWLSTLPSSCIRNEDVGQKTMWAAVKSWGLSVYMFDVTQVCQGCEAFVRT